MSPFRQILSTVIAAPLVIAPFFGQVPARVRGTILSSDNGSITVKQQDGRTFTMKTGPNTTYADVVPSNLDAIKINDHIGTAVKGPLAHWIAVELVLVPEGMRAGRTGYYPWDPLPDTSGIPPSGTLINGLLSSASPRTPGLTNTSMMNGVVTASEPGSRGRMITVILVGNVTAHILVSPTTPIVRFVPSDRSALLVGSAVVVWTNPDSTAKLVAVGNGVTPPM